MNLFEKLNKNLATLINPKEHRMLVFNEIQEFALLARSSDFTQVQRGVKGLKQVADVIGQSRVDDILRALVTREMRLHRLSQFVPETQDAKVPSIRFNKAVKRYESALDVATDVMMRYINDI